ncbi:MAG TPA: NAD-dependent epimerase/dehydratase family protein [Phycisphaerales bacterium]|nr:NAD-dependent epimerase/dehydratase family protein [Phycisphaerales bacterium]
MKLPADKVARLRSVYSGQTVCVTGGTGFIGGHLVDALVSLGATVSVIDDLSNSTLEHLSGLIELEPERVRFTHASILDDDALADAAQGAQIILHLAALGSVPRSMLEPQRYWSVNATGTLRVLEAARKVSARRVVFAASSSAYGDQPTLPKVETQPLNPLSPYAASKIAGEQLLSVWARCYGLSTVSLRYFNVFGPRQPADSAYAAVVAAFAKALIAGEPPTIYGDGAQTRDFTYVSNAVLATLLAGASQAPLSGQVLNVGTARRISIAELATIMAQQTGQPHLQPAHKPERAGDVKHSLADISAARQLIGYEPVATLEEGLAETVEWYRRSLAGAR